ncbi:helix-turn-helix domain-containing protein [Nocardia gamkensis]|uniref:helix-turn-helix domain-containing protein n=1 Tax=Nocardia gamkensis TaxID=352869 RepID=UPI0033ED7067
MTDEPGDSADAHQRFIIALSEAFLRAERRLGHSIKRSELAKRMNVSTASLYAYLNGTTLPNSAVLDRLISELGIVGREAGVLGTLRDHSEIARRTGKRGTEQAQPTDDSKSWPSPAQLPPVPRLFAGRAEEIKLLDSLLTETSHGATIALITGTAGVGKTTLALHWCHGAAQHFPDGQLYVNLRGYDDSAAVDTEEALHRFLAALGISHTSIPPGLDTKAALYRSILATKRILILIDNAETAAHARPLLPGSGACLAVVTSRDRLHALSVREGAQRISLDLPTHDDARAQLAQRIRDTRIRDEPGAVDDLIRLCARLPLALSLVSARAADERALSLAELATELDADRRRLDLLDDDDVGLRTVFRWSYVTLGERESQLFRALGIHPGTDIDRYASAALLGSEVPPDAEIRRLRDAHLVTAGTGGRFTMHDLLRNFATELVTHNAQERVAMIGRLADYYVGAAALANKCIQPCRTDEHPPVRPIAPLPPLTTYEQGMEWFTGELTALHGVIRLTADAHLEPQAWQLAWACVTFLRRTGRRTDRAAMQEIALSAAAGHGDRHAYATTLRLLADARARLGEHETALELLRMSLQDCTDLDDRDGIRQAHLSFARVYDAQALHVDALRHARSAMRAADECASHLARADGLTSVAKQYCALGGYDEALRLATRALHIYAEIQYSEGQADTLVTIARAQAGLRRFHDAAHSAERALALERSLGDRFWEAYVLNLLADIKRELGDHRACAWLREQSTEIFNCLGYGVETRPEGGQARETS